MLGHLNAARRQFEWSCAEPRDQLAKNIVAGLSKAPGVTGQPQVGSDPSGGTNPSGSTAGSNPSGMPSGTPAGIPSETPTGTMKVPQGPGTAGGPGLNGPSNPTGPTMPATPPRPTTSGGEMRDFGSALNGSWKSSPAPGVTIEATLQADKHFTWKFTDRWTGQSFNGTYTLQGDNLVLTRDDDGQKMDGTVTMSGDKGFRFRLRNTDPNDPGLEFSK